MAARSITLIRHGRPALSRNVVLTHQGYREWWARYDDSGLWPGYSVPDAVGRIARSAATVASSPLPRALESARAAAGRDPDHIVPDVVEAPLPPPRLPLRLRPLSWGTVSRITWLLGRSEGGESAREARLRARRAAERLAGWAGDGDVVLFGHGWFNRMVGRELKRLGWRKARDTGDGYWSRKRWEKGD